MTLKEQLIADWDLSVSPVVCQLLQDCNGTETHNCDFWLPEATFYDGLLLDYHNIVKDGRRLQK